MATPLKPSQPLVTLPQRLWIIIDLVVIGCGSIMLGVLMVNNQPNQLLHTLRLILGMAYSLWIPGYCVSLMLFPQQNDLATPARIGISFGVSIAMIPPITVLLDQLPWGITPIPLFVANTTLIFITSVVAGYRRAKLDPEQAYFPLWLIRFWRQLLVGMGLVVGIASILLMLSDQRHQGPTAFYVFADGQQIHQYPQTIVAGQPIELTAWIDETEHETARYRVLVRYVTPTGFQVIHETPLIVATRYQPYPVMLNLIINEAGSQIIQILLLSHNDEHILRQLELQVEVMP